MRLTSLSSLIIQNIDRILLAVDRTPRCPMFRIVFRETMFIEGLNGVNRQPSNSQKNTVNRQKRNIFFTVNREMSKPKLADVKFLVLIF